MTNNEDLLVADLVRDRIPCKLLVGTIEDTYKDLVLKLAEWQDLTMADLVGSDCH